MKRAVLVAIFFAITPVASVAEECLQYLETLQQIACLSRENARLQAEFDQVLKNIDAVIERKVAERAQGFLRSDTPLMIHSEYFDWFCLRWDDAKNSDKGNTSITVGACSGGEAMWRIK